MRPPFDKVEAVLSPATLQATKSTSRMSLRKMICNREPVLAADLEGGLGAALFGACGVAIGRWRLLPASSVYMNMNILN